MKTIIIISILCGSIILISGFIILAVYNYNINLLEKGIVEENILKKEKNKIIKYKEKITTYNGDYVFLKMNNGMTIFIIDNKSTNEIRVDYNFSGSHK